jgi:serine/threonine protein kinase
MDTKCPNLEQLEAFVSQRVEKSQADSIRTHLKHCTACQSRINDLQEDLTMTQRLRQALGIDDTKGLQEKLQTHAAGDFEILENIGQGGTGVVFKARDVRLNKIVAIKCPANLDQQRRLTAAFDEARTLAKINHPNVAAIYSLNENPELPFMVMEFIDGQPITEATEHYSARQVLEVFRQVLQAVTELHKRGIVHRDLKPGNILVDRSGHAKVLDLGIADQMPSLLEAAPSDMSIKGTPAYMAPEQREGSPANPAMDVFSLGVVLFEILTQQRPFTGTTLTGIAQAIRESNPPLPRSLNADIPGPVQAICLTALEKMPENRYSSAREFLLDLERYLQGEPVVASPKMLAHILEHGVERHVNNLSRWQQDRMISTREYDSFENQYDKLRQREEFWILDSRRISVSQVMLHLGVWGCVISAFLMLCPQLGWETLSRLTRVSLPLVVFSILLITGLWFWVHRTRRVAIVLLMGAALTWPLLAANTLITMEWLRNPSDKDLFVDFLTNNQLLAAAGAWVGLSLVLWWRTRTMAFSLIWSLSALILAAAIFAHCDLRKQLEEGNFDTVAGWFLIPAAILFSLALLLDLIQKQRHLAGPLYIVSVAVFLISLTLIARYGPTRQWLGWESIEEVENEIKYSFIINGVIYLVVGFLADRSKRSRWLRQIATVLFWLTPTHVLAPIFLLAIEREGMTLADNWTLMEVLLPAGAIFFIFASVPKQMKSFFFSGLFYVALSVVQLTYEHFENRFSWPIILAATGFTLTLIAWRYPALFERRKK